MSNDPTYTPSVEREARPPRLDLLERCWRLRALPTGRELVALVHESELARNDPNPQVCHRPMAYDTGLPR